MLLLTSLFYYYTYPNRRSVRISALYQPNLSHFIGKGFGVLPFIKKIMHLNLIL